MQGSDKMSFLFGKKVILGEETIFVQIRVMEPETEICPSAPIRDPPRTLLASGPYSCHLSSENNSYVQTVAATNYFATNNKAK